MLPTPPSIHRLELSEGSAHKFWEIERQGLEVVTRWGRIGAKGREKREPFATEALARQAHDRQLAAKLRKGYRPADEVPTAAPAPEPAAWPVRRFELDDGEQHRFAVLTFRGTGFSLRFGEVGARGAERLQRFVDEHTARAAFDALIAELEDGGFVPVASTEVPDAGPAMPAPIEAGLLERLADGDLAAWRVYADGLVEGGEPWGATIVEALSGEAPTGAYEDAVREAFGSSYDAVSVTWRHGVVDGLQFVWPTGEQTSNLEEPMSVTLARAWLQPAMRHVERLTVALPPPHGAEDDHDTMGAVVAGLAKAGAGGLLRELTFSTVTTVHDMVQWPPIGELEPLWRAAPRLRSLRVRGANGDGPALGAVEAPRLEVLSFQTTAMSDDVLESLAAAKLPALHTLELWFGHEWHDGDGSSLAAVERLLGSRSLPALRVLRLRATRHRRELLTALARSPLVGRLETLDLSGGILRGEDLEVVVQRPQPFGHLQDFDLRANLLSPEARAAISRVLPAARVGSQEWYEGCESSLEQPLNAHHVEAFWGLPIPPAAAEP